MAEAKKDAPKDGMAELHDNVNVVIMLATFAASALSLAGLPPGHEAVVYGSIAYTLVDGLWIAARPSMVATPVGIVAHHVVVLGMLYGPIEIPAHGLYASYRVARVGGCVPRVGCGAQTRAAAATLV